MNRASKRISTSLLILLACLASASCAKETQKAQPMSDADMVKRGEYLTTIMSCSDCHTPGTLYGTPDMTRKLSGAEMGWVGPWGVTYPRNLTPEPETGIASWSEQDIVNAIRTGKRPDGTAIQPPMPWPNFTILTDEDALSIAKYLKSLPPVMHKVPDRQPPGAKPVAVGTGSLITLPPQSAWDTPRAAPPTK